MAPQGTDNSSSKNPPPHLPARPPGRFNDWGQRNYIIIAPAAADPIEKEVAGLGLTPRARQLYRAARLTNSMGYEFVFISNAQFPEPLVVNGGEVQIVPCFRPFPVEGGGIADTKQVAMMGRGRFIYDGWIPDESLSPSKVEKAVHDLDEIASTVSLVGSHYAQWEPKYFARDPVPSFIVSPPEAASLHKALTAIAKMPPTDATAIRRTIGWLSSAASSDSPVVRFLHYFVGLESLVTYIERETEPTSPLASFARTKVSRQQKLQETLNCITEKLDSAGDLLDGVREAYFDCIVGARRLLEDHLTRVLGHDSEVGLLFRRGSSGASLWEIRGRIAHGDLDILSEVEVRYVAVSLAALEDLVRSYVRTVTSRATGSEFFIRRRRRALSFSAAEGYGAPGTVYKGTTSMAEIYLGTNDLEAPYVEVTFDT
jgi:hypothetical protein